MQEVSSSRFLVIGGAGSIGQAVTREIFRRNPRALHVVDISENNMVELVREWGGAPQATVIGFGFKAPLPHAAMCNAMMGHGVELDDAHGSGLIKAGSVLVPTLNAIAEYKQVSGKEVLTALVAGYELAVRVAKAINPGHRSRGYHTTGTVSCLGAAAAGARLMGCNAEQIAWAIGLAGMQSAGIQSYLDDPCIAKPFSPDLLLRSVRSLLDGNEDVVS